MVLDDTRLDLESLHAATGRGVRVLVVDSGVETGHPALRQRSIASWRTEIDPRGFRRIVRDEGGDSCGHGTAVAAVIHAHAPDASIDSVRVIGEVGGSSHLVIAALHWAIDQGYHVVNCSFSTPDAQFLADYKTVVDRAFCRNMAIVSACNNRDYGSVEYPGSFPTVLSTDFGPLEGLALRRRPGQLVEFVARGERVLVAYKSGEYRMMTGSSIAAPHLTALVARVLQCRPGWNACQIKSALYDVAMSGIRADGESAASTGS
jgi:subtilisin family serine protease